MTRKGKIKKEKADIYSKYRQILDMPHLTNRQIDQMRKNLGLLARAICEHVWHKKFY